MDFKCFRAAVRSAIVREHRPSGGKCFFAGGNVGDDDALTPRLSPAVRRLLRHCQPSRAEKRPSAAEFANPLIQWYSQEHRPSRTVDLYLPRRAILPLPSILLSFFVFGLNKDENCLYVALLFLRW